MCRKLRPALRNPAAGFRDTAGTRHFAVHNQSIERLTCEHGFHFFGAGHSHDLRSGASEDITFKLQHRLLVFDQQNSSLEGVLTFLDGRRRLRRSGVSRRWQPHFDDGAAGFRIPGRNFSAVFFDDAVTNAETESRSLAYALGGVERLKNAAGFGEARPRIMKFDDHVLLT